MTRRCPEPSRHPGVAFVLALALGLPACGKVPDILSLEGRTMGTGYAITLGAAPADPEALRKTIADELAMLDRQLSNWRDDSELMSFNRFPSTEAMPISDELAEVVSKAQAVSDQTGGALDITLRPLALAWGFQGTDPPTVPSQQERERLLAATGMDLLALATADPDSADSGPYRLRKLNPAVELDVSALAKGYAVDRLATHVRASGVNDFLVEIGGEVRGEGERPGGGAWRVALETQDGAAPREAVALRGEAVATSGDYRNWFEREGRRYAHVLDPATGAPPEHGVAAATVIAPDAMTADALATAFLVLPPETSLALADQLGVALRLVLREKDGYRLRDNAAFARRLIPLDAF